MLSYGAGTLSHKILYNFRVWRCKKAAKTNAYMLNRYILNTEYLNRIFKIIYDYNRGKKIEWPYELEEFQLNDLRKYVKHVCHCTEYHNQIHYFKTLKYIPPDFTWNEDYFILPLTYPSFRYLLRYDLSVVIDLTTFENQKIWREKVKQKLNSKGYDVDFAYKHMLIKPKGHM